MGRFIPNAVLVRTKMSLRLLAWVVGFPLLVAVAGVVYLSLMSALAQRCTRGLNYFGLPPKGRACIRHWMRWSALLLQPWLRLLARLSRLEFERESFTYDGVAGPVGTCSWDSFHTASRYSPTRDDVFVVSQMRSGTTWMLNLVYQVVTRGKGDMVASGKTMYSISPWIESVIGVPIDEAPSVGESTPLRIIKTHLPVSLCPYSPEARYIYVVRHPASCFASCVDFLEGTLGPFTPDISDIEHWFLDEDLMWWGTWRMHVGGWWDASQEHSNVLFVKYEDMANDFGAVLDRIREFLDMPELRIGEAKAIEKACSFAVMQRHKEAFEMYPPHILATGAKFFVKGTTERHRDVPEEARERIKNWAESSVEAWRWLYGSVTPS